MAGRADPRAQERAARRWKNPRVVHLDRCKWHFRQRHHAGRRPRHASASAAVADIGIGQPESRLAIVLLLRHYAVEPDGARAGMCDRPVPDTQPIAAAAQVTPHEIEAEECEGAIVIETGNGRGRRALELANEKPLGIDSVETRGVAQPGIPAFTRGPIYGDGDLRRPHRANAQLTSACHFALLAIACRPFCFSATPITAHSATSLCAESTSSIPPVESRWPATLMISSVRLITWM